MSKDVLIGPECIKGRVRAHRVFENRAECYEDWQPRTIFRPNLVTFEWGALVGRGMTVGGLQYRVGGMYLEFANPITQGAIVSPPNMDRTRDIEYYNCLAGADYLRVPLTASQFLSSDATRFPKGNQPIFFARSSGLYGVGPAHLPFGYEHNSTIYGASLVAFVDPTDATQDLILSSFYFSTIPNEQQPKLSTSQVGLEWELTLE
jgi:hypothetical protein